MSVLLEPPGWCCVLENGPIRLNFFPVTGESLGGKVRVQSRRDEVCESQEPNPTCHAQYHKAKMANASGFAVLLKQLIADGQSNPTSPIIMATCIRRRKRRFE